MLTGKSLLFAFMAVLILAVVYLLLNKNLEQNAKKDREWLSESSYFKQNGSYYYYYHIGDGFNPGEEREITLADPATFRILSRTTAIDKDHVYIQGKMLPGVDVATFSEISKNSDYSYEIFSKDKNKVFLDLESIQDADPNTFSIVPYTNANYQKDKTHVFYNKKTIKGADALTFSGIDSQLGKDKDNIYLMEKIVEGADPVTFVEIKDTQSYKNRNSDPNIIGMYKDKNHTYILKFNSNLENVYELVKQ